MGAMLGGGMKKLSIFPIPIRLWGIKGRDLKIKKKKTKDLDGFFLGGRGMCLGEEGGGGVRHKSNNGGGLRA